MNTEDLKTAAKSLAKLFASFPQSALADIDLQLRSYLDAIDDAELIDVVAAIERFRRGEARTENPQFCPSSAQLCIEIRDRRLMRELVAKRDARLKLVKA